jgi:folate-binding protein YgfZ
MKDATLKNTPDTMPTSALTILESTLGAKLEQEHIANFGDAAAEFVAIGSAALTPLLTSDTYMFTGEDRLEFLHGQVSNTVKGLADFSSNRTLLLNVKGQVQALARVYRLDDRLIVSVDDGAGETFREHMQRHIIFDQVSIEAHPDLLLMSLQGARSGQLLASLGVTIKDNQSANLHPHGAHELQFVNVAGHDVIATAHARSRAGGFDLLVPVTGLLDVTRALQELGVRLAGQDALNIARVEAGIASAKHEAQGKQLPQVSGLDHAVAYNKGCYLGQEIMARIDARGNVRSRLCGVILAEPTNDSQLTLEDKPVGNLSSAVQHPHLGAIALASVRNDVAAGSQLHVGDTTATLCELPFATED